MRAELSPEFDGYRGNRFEYVADFAIDEHLVVAAVHLEQDQLELTGGDGLPAGARTLDHAHVRMIEVMREVMSARDHDRSRRIAFDERLMDVRRQGEQHCRVVTLALHEATETTLRQREEVLIGEIERLRGRYVTVLLHDPAKMCGHVVLNRPLRRKFDQRLGRRVPVAPRVLPQRIESAFKPMMNVVPVRPVLVPVVRRVAMRPMMVMGAVVRPVMIWTVLVIVRMVLRHVVLRFVVFVNSCVVRFPSPKSAKGHLRFQVVLLAAGHDL